MDKKCYELVLFTPLEETTCFFLKKKYRESDQTHRLQQTHLGHPTPQVDLIIFFLKRLLHEKLELERSKKKKKKREEDERGLWQYDSAAHSVQDGEIWSFTQVSLSSPLLPFLLFPNPKFQTFGTSSSENIFLSKYYFVLMLNNSWKNHWLAFCMWNKLTRSNTISAFTEEAHSSKGHETQNYRGYLHALCFTMEPFLS